MIDDDRGGRRAVPADGDRDVRRQLGDQVVSRDPERLSAVIAGLTTHSTADCPEGSNAALMTAGRQLGRGGQAVLATDADSHRTGPSRETRRRALRVARALRLNTLLSGSCPPEQNPPRGPRGARRAAAAVPRGAAPDEDKPPDQLGPENALRTFSEETLFSGGVFEFRPEVKTGSRDALTRYSNALANLAISAVAPTVAAATPAALPRGTALDVELEGSGTSFAEREHGRGRRHGRVGGRDAGAVADAHHRAADGRGGRRRSASAT